MGKYLWEIFSRALYKSCSKLGMMVNLLLYAIAIMAYLIIRKPTIEELLKGELMLAVWFLLAVFLLTLIVSILWEKQVVFADVRLEKRNTLRDAEMVIWNNGVSDLTELSVEILGKLGLQEKAKLEFLLIQIIAHWIQEEQP